MGWADHIIQALLRGEVVQCRPRGHSMKPRIKSGQLITLDPGREPSVGDAVLCLCKGKQYVHLVRAISGDGRHQIANNHGHINGWVARSAIFGVVTKIED